MKKIITLLIFLNTFSFFAQTCDGNTFTSPGAPANCTFSYIAPGIWVDAAGVPTTKPNNINNTVSVCILTDLNDNFGTVRGALYVPAGVKFTGSLGTVTGDLIIEGTMDIISALSFANNARIYIDVNGIFSIQSNYSPGGSTILHNAGAFNVSGNILLGGSAEIYNYSDAYITVMGDVQSNSTIQNCGVLEVVNGQLSIGGGSSLQNLCTTYVRNDVVLNSDFTNEGLFVIDGNLNFGSNDLYNSDIMVVNSININNSNLIGVGEALLIVRTNAVLSSGGSITNHSFHDVDDGGGFDSVCAGCTEEVFVVDVTFPTDVIALTQDCGVNIQIIGPTPIASIDFDGVNDYITADNFMQGKQDITMMGWVLLDPAFNTAGGITGERVFHTGIDANRRLTSTVITNQSNFEHVNTGTTVLDYNQWYHVTATYSGATGVSQLFLNGKLENQISTAIGTLSTNGIFATDFTIGKNPKTYLGEYFNGNIDEVRSFNKVLGTQEIRRLVHQEIEDNAGKVKGKILPENIDESLGTTLEWNDLEAYYPMTNIIYLTKTEDYSGKGRDATMHNITTIQAQTAPMPYISINDGNWEDQSTWLHGDVWDIENLSNTNDPAIVQINHNISTLKTKGTVGLFVAPNKTLTINSDQELYNDWYLNLKGKIDLQGESQLVQSQNSVLDAPVSGLLERDQQGTKNLFTYNYWSSPVHTANPNGIIDGDETYTVAGVLNDASDPLNIQPFNFIGGYNGDATTSPKSIANYWIYKYTNGLNGEYSLWQQIFSTGTIKVGEGYTMKGMSMDPISDYQNYAFLGTPNNGRINLNISSGSAYLTGNPYPSALDAVEFLNDNPQLDGTLYFFEHYGGNSHVLAEYQAGYGMYNYSGGVPAISGSQATAASDVDQGGMPTKTPRRYVAVGQGFFVLARVDGIVTFENDQRIFVKETGNTNSWFIRNSANQTSQVSTNLDDVRPKFRIGYKSPEGHKRQLLLTLDENATLGKDWGFEAPAIEDYPEDMFWAIDDEKFYIQGINDVDATTELPLIVRSREGGIAEIDIDLLEHVSDSQEVYLVDNGYYHNLRASKYMTTVDAGETANRFKIVFAEAQVLGVADQTLSNDFVIFYNSNSNEIVIKNNPSHFINTITLVNALGQQLLLNELDTTRQDVRLPVRVQAGVYIVSLSTSEGKVNKKIIIK